MELINCSKKYTDKQVLKNINIKFDNKIYHICGSNGTGKSVFCRCIAGLENFTSGIIVNKGKKILYLTESMIGEDYLTLRENIDLFLYYFKIKISQSDKNHIYDLLNINSELDRDYYHLSVGTKIKASMFLVCLSNCCDLIIIDEGLSHLDVTVRRKILDELEERTKENCNIIIVDHTLTSECKNGFWETIEMEIINGK